MLHLSEEPTQEDNGGGNLDGIELDLVEKPVRIEAAALHKSPSRPKRFATPRFTLLYALAGGLYFRYLILLKATTGPSGAKLTCWTLHQVEHTTKLVRARR
jgi:hypothetical protein